MVSLRLCLLRLLPSRLSSQGAIALTLAIASSLVTPKALTPPSLARPIADDSLGRDSTIVDRQGNDFLIDSGVRRRRNLFHSFREFSLTENQRAIFDGTGFDNIFSRVTGSNRSDIDGTLRVNGDANLFLMNPQGILFGPNARLDLRGSFVATTADQIEFGNRGSFQANSLEVPDDTLTIDPTAFVFNQVNGLPAVGDRRIINRAERPGLSVARGRSLLMLGGEVEFDGGYAQATNGRIQIGGLSEAGEVEFETRRDGREFRLSFLDDAALADITFGNSSVVDVTSSNRGDIAITGQNIAIIQGSSLCGGIGVPFACVGGDDVDLSQEVGSDRSQAGNISIGASGTVSINSGGRVVNVLNENATGNSIRDIREAVDLFVESDEDDNTILFGSVLIAGQVIDIQAPALINTDTFGRGNAGLVFLSASRVVNLVGQIPQPIDAPIPPLVSSSVNLSGVGDAGGVLVTAPIFNMSNFASISSSTFGEGNPGSVEIQGGIVSLDTGSSIFSTIEPNGVATDDIARNQRTEDEGAIYITANIFSLQSGSQIQTLVRGRDPRNAPEPRRRPGVGDAGDIVIFASSVFINGTNPLFTEEPRPSAVISSAGTGARGDGGFIFIFADNLELSDSARIEAVTLGRDGSTGGDVLIFANESVGLLNNAGVNVSAFGENTEAGNIAALLGDEALFVVAQDSFLAAITNSGDGGDIFLNGSPFLILLNESNVSTTAGTAEAGGDGGNIVLGFAAVFGEPFRDSNITAQAFDGDGGNITAGSSFLNLFQIEERPDDFTISNDITASSEFGADGIVTINELDVKPPQGIIELPELIVDPDRLLVQACPGPGQATEELGAFYVTGRGGIPPAPSELGRSNGVEVPWVSPSDQDLEESDLDESSSGETSRTVSMPNTQIEAQDWIEDENGDVWLVANAERAIAPPPLPELCVSVPSAASQSDG
ncbi:MAG: filamentous hemagglutinin N-terminal domain-containing protein [Elainellaceae cyanobacterium]